jgi:hypothetical protein
MEAHLVHKNLETGNLAVLGVFIEGGGDLLPNPCIQEALRSAPTTPLAETQLQRPISLQTLLPKVRTADGMRPYAHYRCGAGQWVCVWLPGRLLACIWLSGSRGVRGCLQQQFCACHS